MSPLAYSAASQSSPAAVWADVAVPRQLTPSLASLVPSLKKEAGVAETCVKEALNCEVSPLGFHLAANLKEKFWKKEYVDILLGLKRNQMIKLMKKSAGLCHGHFIIGCRHIAYFLLYL